MMPRKVLPFLTRLATILVGAALVGGVARAAEPDLFYLCPTIGTARTQAGKQLNRLKNRRDIPARPDFDSELTLARLLQPGNDRSRWFQDQAVDLVAYVVAVEDARPDSCNCDRTWPELTSTRLELAVSDDARDQRPANRLVAVVTPRWRAMMKEQGFDWSTAALRREFEGTLVRIQGWLLFDTADLRRARNTARGTATHRRATAWEIHPVTSIALVPAAAPEVDEPRELTTPLLVLPDLGVEIQPFEFSSR